MRRETRRALLLSAGAAVVLALLTIPLSALIMRYIYDPIDRLIGHLSGMPEYSGPQPVHRELRQISDMYGEIFATVADLEHMATGRDEHRTIMLVHAIVTGKSLDSVQLEDLSMLLPGLVQSPFRVVLIEIDRFASRRPFERVKTSQLALDCVRDTLRDHLLHPPLWVYSGGYTVLAAETEPDTFALLRVALEACINETRTRSKGETTVSIVTSERIHHVGEAAPAFQRCRRGMTHRIRKGGGMFIELDRTKEGIPRKFGFPDDLEYEMIHAVRMQDDKRLERLTDELLRVGEEWDPNDLRYVAMQIGFSALKDLHTLISGAQLGIISDYRSLVDALDTVYGRDDLVWWFRCILRIHKTALEEIHSTKNDKNRVVLSRSMQSLKERLSDPDPSLETLAAEARLSPGYFSRLLKEFTGHGFSELLAELRLQEAKRMLEHSDEPIKAVSGVCGFSNTTYFYRVFKAKTGLTPTEYRHGARRNSIYADRPPPQTFVPF